MDSEINFQGKRKRLLEDNDDNRAKCDKIETENEDYELLKDDHNNEVKCGKMEAANEDNEVLKDDYDNEVKCGKIEAENEDELLKDDDNKEVKCDETETEDEDEDDELLDDDDDNNVKCGKIGTEDEEEEDIDVQQESSKPDPFVDHFNYELPYEDTTCNLDYQPNNLEFPVLGKMIHFKPSQSSVKVPTDTPECISQFNVKANLLKAVLVTNSKDDNDASISSQITETKGKKIAELSPFQLNFYNLISNYVDLIYMQRTHTKGEPLRRVFALHVLNHILKSKALILRHNSKLVKHPDSEFRDQGFTKTTALILVPFRHDCFRIIQHVISLLRDCTVMNRKRFEKEYGPPPKVQRMKKKPPDYEHTFEGNIDEDFKIGVKILNKSITLYSEFYASDLIIASPLGLRQIIGAEGDKERDFDFLSSIEILILDRADVMYFQNINHLQYVFQYFNLLPKASHDCDFFRVRMYAVQGMAKYYRQTILTSSVEHRWFESNLFRNFCFNHCGYLSSLTKYKSLGINQIYDTVKVVFRFFEFTDLKKEADDRFDFFVNEVLPSFKADSMAQTLIYIPDYYDFVKLRNYFRENEISAVMVCEYSKAGKVAQARDNFFKGRRHFMLYTERCHFYHRYHIKGIQHLLFYQPPTYPVFFQEMNFAFKDSNPRRAGEEKSCTLLASRKDLLQLKSIVGLEELKRMLSSENKIFIRYVT